MEVEILDRRRVVVEEEVDMGYHETPFRPAGRKGVFRERQ